VAPIRFYLDENVEVEVGVQLSRRGIDCVHIRDIDMRGQPDDAHLQRARQEERVLCTYDRDFLRIAQQGLTHSGIVLGDRSRHRVGDWVRALTILHARASIEEMHMRIEFLSTHLL
jgi:hypothetical protein